MRKIHLVVLKPREAFAGMRRLLKWDKARAVPVPGCDVVARQLVGPGMACEIDDEDLVAAATFCDVVILATKEQTP